MGTQIQNPPSLFISTPTHPQLPLSSSATILTFQSLTNSFTMPPIPALLATWLTPSSLFIVVNIVIGTIAVTSRFARQNHHSAQHGPHHSPQLVRSPSLLQRVRSFRGGYYSYDPTVALSETATDCAQPQLVRTPSLLERVRSFKLGHYSYSSEPTTAFAEPESTQPQLVRTPSLLERVRSFNLGFHKHETSHAETEYGQAQAQAHEPESESPKEPQLVRAPSLLQRLQSINLSRIYRSETVHVDEESEPEGPDSEPGRGSGVNSVEMMRKSASERGREVKCEWEEDEDEETVEKRRPETARCETTSYREDEEVDARADDFINRFKKQLRLQRVDSLLRYREMLRGN